MKKSPNIFNALFYAFFLSACTQSIELETIHLYSVEPDTLELEQPFIIHGQGFPSKQKSIVTFHGQMYRPGKETLELHFELDGYSPNSNAIVIDSPSSWIHQFHGLGTFHGSLTVTFSTRAISGTIQGILEDFNIQIPPQSLHPKKRAELKKQAETFLASHGIKAEQSGSDQGVVIRHVDPKSLAYQSGIRTGDLLRSIGKLHITSMQYANAPLGDKNLELSVLHPETLEKKTLALQPSLQRFSKKINQTITAYLMVLLTVILMVFSPIRKILTASEKPTRRKNVFHFLHEWSTALPFGKTCFILGTPLMSTLLIYFSETHPKPNLILFLTVLPSIFLLEWIWNFKKQPLPPQLLQLISLLIFTLGFGFCALLIFGTLEVHDWIKTQNEGPASWWFFKHPSLTLIHIHWFLILHQTMKAQKPPFRFGLLLISIFSAALFWGGWPLVGEKTFKHAPALSWLLYPSIVLTFKSYAICFLSWRIFQNKSSIEPKRLLLITLLLTSVTVIISWAISVLSISLQNMWTVVSMGCLFLLIVNSLIRSFQKKKQNHSPILHWPFL